MKIIIKFCVFNDYGDFETEIEVKCNTWKQLDEAHIKINDVIIKVDGKIKDIFEIDTCI